MSERVCIVSSSAFHTSNLKCKIKENEKHNMTYLDAEDESSSSVDLPIGRSL